MSVNISDIRWYKIHPPTCNGSHTQQVLRGHTMLLYILRNIAVKKVPYFFFKT